MTNVESMDYTHSYPSIIASLFGTVHCPFSHWELAQTSPVHPNPVIWYALSHINSHHTYLKTATTPTYYGISIAIPRYIAMQLSIISFVMTHSSLSYCLAWSCSWHSICGKATVHNSFIHVTLGSLHIPVHRRRHSHRVIFVLVSSCNHWVVNK